MLWNWAGLLRECHWGQGYLDSTSLLWPFPQDTRQKQKLLCSQLQVVAFLLDAFAKAPGPRPNQEHSDALVRESRLAGHLGLLGVLLWMPGFPVGKGPRHLGSWVLGERGPWMSGSSAGWGGAHTCLDPLLAVGRGCADTWVLCQLCEGSGSLVSWSRDKKQRRL